MLSIIEQRLNEYEIDTEAQQENALKEITQEIILSALAEAQFFDVDILLGAFPKKGHYQSQSGRRKINLERKSGQRKYKIGTKIMPTQI